MKLATPTLVSCISMEVFVVTIGQYFLIRTARSTLWNSTFSPSLYTLVWLKTVQHSGSSAITGISQHAKWDTAFANSSKMCIKTGLIEWFCYEYVAHYDAWFPNVCIVSVDQTVRYVQSVLHKINSSEFLSGYGKLTAKYARYKLTSPTPLFITPHWTKLCCM